jgi:hypothetical protein
LTPSTKIKAAEFHTSVAPSTKMDDFAAEFLTELLLQQRSLQLSFSIWSPSTRKINPNPLIPETAGPQRKQTPSKKQERR